MRFKHYKVSVITHKYCYGCWKQHMSSCYVTEEELLWNNQNEQRHASNKSHIEGSFLWLETCKQKVAQEGFCDACQNSIF